MLDDVTFAAKWVESRDRARPRGERALRSELRNKGIDSETIARIIEARDAEEDADEGVAATADEVAARRLITRHAASLERIADPRARRQRAYALLARNGFDPETAGSIAAELETTERERDA